MLCIDGTNTTNIVNVLATYSTPNSSLVLPPLHVMDSSKITMILVMKFPLTFLYFFLLRPKTYSVASCSRSFPAYVVLPNAHINVQKVTKQQKTYLSRISRISKRSFIWITNTFFLFFHSIYVWEEGKITRNEFRATHFFFSVNDLWLNVHSFVIYSEELQS